MSRVSVLQLSTRTHVVLLDTLTLLRAPDGAAAALTPTEDAVDALLGGLFVQGASGTILVGFQFAGDLSRLALSYPRLQCFRSELRIVDALKCAALVHPGLEKRSGLGAVIETVLGAPLDKTCQCSEWEDRPLSPAQREYAALDAWCLVRLAEVVVDQLRRDSTSSLSVDSAAGRVMSVVEAWQRVESVAEPVVASDNLSSRGAAAVDDDEEDVDEGAKRGGIAVGRDGVVSFGVAEVERAVSQAEARFAGDVGFGAAAQAAPPTESKACVETAEFYVSVGQKVQVLPNGVPGVVIGSP